MVIKIDCQFSDLSFTRNNNLPRHLNRKHPVEDIKIIIMRGMPFYRVAHFY